MPSSGVNLYDPSVIDATIDAFERCGKGLAQLTTEHFFSARRSCGLVLTRWANRSVNLWKVDEEPTEIVLLQGVASYPMDRNVISMLDTYIRTYSMAETESIAPDFSTVNTSAVVTIGMDAHGMSVDNWLNIVIPVSVGGIILHGFYQVRSVVDDATFTITSDDAATATVNNAGAVPEFTTITASANVTVELEDHAKLSGETFYVEESITVGNITLLGAYTIASVTDADHFVIAAASAATANDVESENDGLAQIAPQNTSAAPTDIPLTAISRNNYAAMPNKELESKPTCYWFNRQITPSVTVWPLANATGPYVMRTYLMRQIYDAVPQGLQTLDLPSRFFYAFIAALAADLCIKWAPERRAMLKEEATEAWDEASDADREQVTTTMIPDFSAYGG